MLIREKYLKKIRGFYHTESLIKIIYGMRRSGKSVILTQIIDELKQNGISEENIIYINFESLKYDFIKNAKDLFNYIESLKINNNKYYANDLGIKQIKTNNENINYSVALENIVYNDLIGKDYKVYVGKTKKGEIDFIASKNNKFKYIQVCYDLSTEETRKREFDAFKELDESTDKYIITLTKENYSKEDIKQIYIYDFLMIDDF